MGRKADGMEANDGMGEKEKRVLPRNYRIKK
jgi:hypothetical protein